MLNNGYAAYTSIYYTEGEQFWHDIEWTICKTREDYSAL